MRDANEQHDFRERLFQQHYHEFYNHRIFCHATLTGFWDRNPTQVHAHHIHQLARHATWPLVNDICNGILLDPIFHQELHKQVNRWNSCEAVTARLVTNSFNKLWKKASHIWLAQDVKLVDVWDNLLLSKRLIRR